MKGSGIQDETHNSILSTNKNPANAIFCLLAWGVCRDCKVSLLKTLEKGGPSMQGGGGHCKCSSMRGSARILSSNL